VTPSGKPNVANDEEPTRKWYLYEWYVVFVLILAATLSFIDRQIITLLVQPIREDLGISDTQISLLMGAAFAIFYVIMGVPIARLSDSLSRRKIISAGIVLWSFATITCGLSKTYWQLFLARVGVGVGEATLVPAAYSMLSDLFPKRLLGRAIGAFATAIFLGAGLSMLLGGYAFRYVSQIGEVVLPFFGVIKPWQMTFIVVGLPGFALALLIMLTVKEPARHNMLAADNRNAVSVRQLISFLIVNRKTLASIFSGYAFGGIAFYGFLFWVPEFLRRTYGMDISTAGIIFGSQMAVLGTIGAFSGGWFCDWLTDKGYKDAPVRTAAIVFAVLAPIMLVTPLMPDATQALVMLGVLSFVMSLQQSLSPVAIQLITPNQMRAQVTSLFFVVASLSGIALGASSVALITDLVFADDSSLRYSLSWIGVIAMSLGALALWMGRKHYCDSLDRSSAWETTRLG